MFFYTNQLDFFQEIKILKLTYAYTGDNVGNNSNTTMIKPPTVRRSTATNSTKMTNCYRYGYLPKNIFF